MIVDQEEEKQESVMDVMDEVHKLGEEEDSLEHLKLSRTSRPNRHFEDMCVRDNIMYNYTTIDACLG